METNIVLDGVKEAEKALKDFPNRAPSVISGAINRSLTNMGSNINKEVRGKYTIKSKDVRGSIDKTKSTRATLTGKIISEGSVIPLDKFKVNPKTVQPNRKKQLKVTVKKGEAKQVMGAFIASINGIKVFKRTGSKRLPIKRLHGPSVPQMVGNEDVVKKVEAEGMSMFSKRMEQGVNRILKGYGK